MNIATASDLPDPVCPDCGTSMVTNYETGRYQCVNCGTKVGIVDAVVATKVAEKAARIAALEAELAEAKARAKVRDEIGDEIDAIDCQNHGVDMACKRINEVLDDPKTPHHFGGPCLNATVARLVALVDRAEQAERAFVYLDSVRRSETTNPDVAAVRERMKVQPND